MCQVDVQEEEGVLKDGKGVYVLGKSQSLYERLKKIRRTRKMGPKTAIRSSIWNREFTKKMS